jgi:hypothetical protein
MQSALWHSLLIVGRLRLDRMIARFDFGMLQRLLMAVLDDHGELVMYICFIL